MGEESMDGKEIARRRKEKGLTQDALGQLLGISGKAVSKWERNLSELSEKHMEALVELFGLEVENVKKIGVETVESEETERGKGSLCLLNLIRKEFFRMAATSFILGVCLANLLGVVNTRFTVVCGGLGVVVFFLDTMFRGD